MKKNSLEHGVVLISSPVDTHHNLKTQRVAIVMAAYNGGRFIEEQIRSIQAQSHSDWMLYVRDDGSSDDTVQKVLLIKACEPRLRLVVDKHDNQGAMGNFSLLMQVAFEEKADYIFFADQDDVWHSEKLATMLLAIQELELKHGKQMPLLVHSDLTVVDEDLNTIADSFNNFSRFSPIKAGLDVLLCQNQVAGCACVINRALLELALPVPPNVLMHDWWLVLLASASGKVGFISKQLMLYRQHGGNVLGAVSLGRRIKELLLFPSQWKVRANIVKLGIVQAGVLEERIRERCLHISPVILKQINTYSHILNVHPMKRVKELRMQNIGREESLTRILFYLVISIMNRNEDGAIV